MASVTPEDAQLVRQVATDSRVLNVTPLHSGDVFVLARAKHTRTRRDVLLSIARPRDIDARTQLTTTRTMLGAVNDERVGIVIDVLWDQEDRSNGWLCLVSNFHSGYEPLDSALLNTVHERQVSIVGTLRSVCRQLLAIHEAGYAHGDVSMQNIGVDANGEAHLIDFEHTVGEENLTRPRVATTQGYTHPSKLASIRHGHYSVAEHQTWDRYAIGQVFLDVLSHVSPHSNAEMTPRNERALRLLGCLLLDGENTQTELALGIGKEFFAEEKFTELSQVIAAIDRLTGRLRVEDSVPELQEVGHSVVEAGVSTPVPLTARVKQLLRDPHMRYLDEFYQLGLICFIWPTATHRRREHAVGTFGASIAYVNSLLADPESPLFQVLVTPYRAKCLILAALLHDIGHYPLAHDFEEAHPSAFDHEGRSVSLICGSAIGSIISAPESDDGWGVRPEDVASVISGKPISGASIGSRVCGLFHSIISGPIDADKIDYLVRDSSHLNVKAGEGIDVKRIVRSLTVVVTGDQGVEKFSVGVRNKGRRPAELVGRIRSHMFGVAYWHHSYRSIKAMLQWITWSAMELDKAVPQSADSLATALFDEIDRVIGLEKHSVINLDSSKDPLPLFSSLASGGLGRGALPPAEAHILRWMVERGGQESRCLWDLLADQRWFASVLSLDHPKNTSGSRDADSKALRHEAWKALRGIENEAVDRRWRHKVAVARSIQDQVTAWLEPQTEGEQPTIVRDFSETKWQLLEASKVERIFLVDGTDKARASQKPLYYTDESTNSGRSVDASARIPTMRSYDEACLSDEFVASNGAIRLLCHPSYSTFVSAAISEGRLLDFLIQALSTTE